MSSSRLLLAVLLVLPAVRAGVIVVDPNGGGDFTTVSAAVAAAVDGDVVFVHPGTYVEGLVTVDNKALTIVGEPTGMFFELPTLTSGLMVRNMAAGKQVVIENLHLLGLPSTSSSPATAGLLLRDNISHVRVQGCDIMGGYGASNDHLEGAAAVAALNCTSTALIWCSVLGGTGQFSAEVNELTGDGGPGISNFGTNPQGSYQMLVSACSVEGGQGGSYQIGFYPFGGNGGPGILQQAGTVLVMGCSPKGGEGGYSALGGDGGPGLMASGSGKVTLLGGSQFTGGQGGVSENGPDGADGPNTVAPAGAVTDFGGTPHDFGITSPLRVGEVGQLTLSGGFNATTLIFVSLVPGQIPFPGYQGVLSLSPTGMIGPFVVGSPSPYQLPFVGPSISGLEALNVYVQPAYAGGGDVNLGTGQVLTLLDASF